MAPARWPLTRRLARVCVIGSGQVAADKAARVSADKASLRAVPRAVKAAKAHHSLMPRISSETESFLTEAATNFRAAADNKKSNRENNANE
eukprot:5933378-Pyramimonas_sp.AAC.1